jgi:hypothetical protein
VIQETEYVAASAAPVVNTEEDDVATGTSEEDVELKPQAKEVSAMRDEKVAALITCEQNTFCEDDREFLMGLEDDQFAKIEALAASKEEPSTEEVVEETTTTEEVVEETTTTEEVVEETPAAEAPVKVQKLEDLVANADPELRESIEAGQKVLRDQKDELVKGIMDNKRNKFTEDQLRSKSMDELTTLAELAQVEVDFSPKIGGPTPIKGKTVPDAPRMKWNKDASPDYSHLDEEK